MSEAPKCCERTWPDGSCRPVSCLNDGKVERDGGWYCGVHDPVAIEEKSEAIHKKYMEEFEATQKAKKASAEKRAEEQRRACCFDDLLEALKSLLQDVRMANSMNGAIKARAAIAKATGGEK